MKRDSIDKIVTSYFAAVCAEPFTYKGKHYPVPMLTVSPLILRGFTCPPVCGGCCPVFSLDYIPGETTPATLSVGMRYAEFNGRQVEVYTNWQDKRTEHHCQNLNMDNGRCNVHGRQPFSCDFELIRFFHYQTAPLVRASVQLFGRGHAMLRVDGERGARCTITPATPETVSETRRKLRRLQRWCDHFRLANRVAHIIDWIDSGPTTALVLPSTPSPGFFY